MDSFPKISVIIPSFNNAEFLQEALDSVYAQNYLNIEIIVVDDGSTDGTKDVDFIDEIKFYSIPHSGAAVARNFGVKQSTGDLLAFLDADDLWPLDKLHTQVQGLIQKNLDAMFTNITQFVDTKAINLKIKDPNKVMQGLCASTMLIRRDIFLKIGWFNTQYKIGEFIEWFIRAKQQKLKFSVIEHLLSKRRIHGNNTSSRCKAHKNDYLKMLYEGLKYRDTHAIAD